MSRKLKKMGLIKNTAAKRPNDRGFNETVETRGQRLVDLARCDWGGTTALGNLPFPLRYAGAHTQRLSGDTSACDL